MENVTIDIEKALTLDYPWRRTPEPLAYVFRKGPINAPAESSWWDIIIAHKSDVELILKATAGRSSHVAYTIRGARIANSDSDPQQNRAEGLFAITGPTLTANCYFAIADLYVKHLGDLM